MKLLALTVLVFGATVVQAQDTYREMSDDQTLEVYSGIVADNPYKKCGRDAKDAVRDALRLAGEWAAEIAGQVKSSQ
jgi:hypothetical protein